MMQETQASRVLEGLEIGTLEASEIGEALDVVARGMRDNPVHFAAYGADPDRRLRAQRRLMSAAFAIKDFSHTLVARTGEGVIVGVCGMMPPGDCQPTAGQQLRLLPLLLRLGPGVAGRTARWLGAWSKHDPDERHWHLGPVAVDAHLQGKGIGSVLMRVFCARMDAASATAYLETDKEVNVRFYEKFGFEVIGEQQVVGVLNWFMLRRARSGQTPDGGRFGGEGGGMAEAYDVGLLGDSGMDTKGVRSVTTAGRRYYNPVQKDYATFLETSEEAGGEYTLIEIEVAPDGGNAPHYHKTYAEHFEVLRGEIEVMVGGKTRTLRPGERAVAPEDTVHNFRNRTGSSATFLVEFRPGVPGFEKALRVGYGLARDGLTSDKGIPKNPYHLAVLLEWSDIRMRGALAHAGPLFRLLAWRVRRKGIDRELEARYCR